jgi:hypothetical protein
MLSEGGAWAFEGASVCSCEPRRVLEASEALDGVRELCTGNQERIDPRAHRQRTRAVQATRKERDEGVTHLFGFKGQAFLRAVPTLPGNDGRQVLAHERKEQRH